MVEQAIRNLAGTAGQVELADIEDFTSEAAFGGSVDCARSLHFAAIIRSGLTVTSLREFRPDTTRFDGDADEIIRRRRVPLFLQLNARASVPN